MPYRHVEQHERTGDRPLREQTRTGAEHVGTVRSGRRVEALFEARQQAGEIRTGERQLLQGGGRDSREAQLLQRGGEGARKAGGLGDRAEVAEHRVAVRVEGCSRGDRFGAEPRARRDAVAGECHDRGSSGQLREAQTMDAERRRALRRNRPREIVSRAARGADDGDRVVRGEPMQEGGCRLEA
jgi:hypothetical protein